MEVVPHRRPGFTHDSTDHISALLLERGSAGESDGGCEERAGTQGETEGIEASGVLAQ